MSTLNSDEITQELVQLIIKGSKISKNMLQSAMRDFINSKAVINAKFDEKGRIPLEKLGIIDGKTSNTGTEVAAKELKLIEKELKSAGVKRWSAEKIGDNYIISFPDSKANEVEIAFKKHLERVSQPQKIKKYSIDGLYNIFKKKALELEINQEAKAKIKSISRER